MGYNYVFLLISVMQMVFIGLAIGRSLNSKKLAIVNDEVKVIDGNCPYKDTCSFSNLGCRFIAHLKNQSISADYYANLESAKKALNWQYDLGIIYINENFTDTFTAKLALGEDADEETITAAQIQVLLDDSKETGKTLKNILQSAFKEFTENLLSTCSLQDRAFNFDNPFLYKIIVPVPSNICT